MTVCLLIPALNEIDGLRALAHKIKKDWYDKVVILDGGSTDGTREYARQLGFEVVQQTGKGMRQAYLDWYPSCREDIVVVFSPDGNSVLETIPFLTEKIRSGYDMVIASRYKDEAKSYDDTAMTLFGNRVFTGTIAKLFGFPYTDAMVMFRAYRREVPAILKLNVRRSGFYEKYLGRHVSWEPLMSIRAAKAGLRIAEIPSDEPKRIEEGKSRILLPSSRINHYKAGLACGLQVLEELLFWKF